MTKREERIAAQVECRRRLPQRYARALAERAERGAQRSSVGLKRWFIPGSEFEGTGVLTPYAARERRRRRKVSRIAKRARKRNR